MRLHGYARSCAMWRVRIALALKKRPVELAVDHLPADCGNWSSVSRLHPHSRMLTLETDDGVMLTQSLAIVEWLEEMWPSPALLPPDPQGRARVRSFAHDMVGDIHLVQSHRLLGRLQQLGMSEVHFRSWVRQTLSEGLEGSEALLSTADGPFCFGDLPGIADICLVPQLALAREFGVELAFPRLLAAEAACLTLPAFCNTRPSPLSQPVYQMADHRHDMA
jgi:maleylpyruvate isomerase